MRRIEMFSDRHAAYRALLSPRLVAKRGALVVLILLLLAYNSALALPKTTITPCTEDFAKSSVRPNLVKAVDGNKWAVVTIVVLRPRRDPFEELSGLDSLLSLSSLPKTEGEQPERGGASSMERSFSSGFIVHTDGQVLTSAHAVHDAQEVWVFTADGRRFPATSVGFDRRSDVAVLKISGSHLPVVQMMPTVSLCAGEWVAALGAPFGLEHSVTAGVISAFPRFLPGDGAIPWIQTDAALNPGSSGGPVLNADGVVVGMSAMVYSNTGIFMGVAFALPIDRALRIARQLTSNGLVQRGHIGVVIQPVSLELAQAFGLLSAGGVVVLSVDAGGSAEKAGLRSGDIVLQVDIDEQRSTSQTEQALHGLAIDIKAASPVDIEDRISMATPGTSLGITIWRQRALKYIRLTVATALGQSTPRLIPKRIHALQRLGLEFVQHKQAPQMPAGIYVEGVTGASLLAGIEYGDRIVAVNNLPVLTVEDFDSALKNFSQHERVALLVQRDRIRFYVAVIKDVP
jgi:serine protease Do